MKQLDDNTMLFSPSDLTTFLGCRHATYLDMKCFREEIAPPPISNTNKLLQEKGLEHERNYLQALKNQAKQVIEIPRTKSLPYAIKFTKDALCSGADIIYQANLCDDFWNGNADFLIKVNTPSALGDYSYQVADTKLTRVPEPKHLIQLCSYTELLGKLQGANPKQMSLILGNNQTFHFNYLDFAFYYKIIKTNFADYMQNFPKDSYPAPCKHCEICHWQLSCKEQWQDDEHLSLIANIKRAEIDQLNKVGIKTIQALVSLKPATMVEEINPDVLSRLQSQAALQLYKRQSGKEKYELLSLRPGKGFERLPQPNKGDLFFDMEGDPLYPKGLEYLFGIYYEENTKPIYKAFWAHNHFEEQQAFQAFMAFLKHHLDRYPQAHIYHYNHYENTALKRLSGRYGLCEEQLDNLLREHQLVDLYKVVCESIRISESSYSIKDLEVFYGAKRDGLVKTAMDSVESYNQWQICHDEALLEEIKKYNEVDCISTLKLRNWLISIKPTDIPWFKQDNRVEKEASSERKPWEIQYEDYQRRLSQIKKTNLAMPLLDLLEFHNREVKPQWWAFFERQDKLEYELISDADCLGGLTLVGEPVAEKQSFIYTYQFPAQETKLKVGSRVYDSQEPRHSAGEIIELNEEQGFIKIKRGKRSGALPVRFSIGPGKPLKVNELRDALYRMADSIIQQDHNYQAIEDILSKSTPRLLNKKAGESIIDSSDLQKGVLKAVSQLNNSYLFIQGPPGAGKTFTSSHIIIALMRLNKKIGVTANSHKAIHNLLIKIEALALEENFQFKGIKRSSDEESAYSGQFIKNTSSKDKLDDDCLLFAGTAWLFVDAFFQTNKLDFLFIDEAGQVSVANVITMGTAAYNIILIGDQMQLAQPLKGTHPGEAGLSILDFLLGDKATVSAEQGIFLKNTYRMRPSICNFISQAFYDGFLSTHLSVLERELLFNTLRLPKEGIVILPIEHEGCSQKSVEEGQTIKALYNKLLQQKIKEGDEGIRPITSHDILVVSPYNVQVNYLRAILPKGAQVGTIDKFQGQEAAIVLVSMATSSAEDLPRNIEFFYSKNRLNVAVSRAQCLAVIVFNKELLNIPCKTVEQMKLVNSFCWLYDYGQKIAEKFD